MNRRSRANRSAASRAAGRATAAARPVDRAQGTRAYQRAIRQGLSPRTARRRRAQAVARSSTANS